MWRAAALGLVLLLVPTVNAPAQQSTLPDLQVLLRLEVRDVAGWLTLYDDVLRSAPESPKPFIITVAAGTGETRSVIVDGPKFEVHLNPGASLFKVSVTGKMSGALAVATLAVFEDAVLNAADRQVAVAYGLSSATATLVEMQFNRP